MNLKLKIWDYNKKNMEFIYNKKSITYGWDLGVKNAMGTYHFYLHRIKASQIHAYLTIFPCIVYNIFHFHLNIHDSGLIFSKYEIKKKIQKIQKGENAHGCSSGQTIKRFRIQDLFFKTWNFKNNTKRGKMNKNFPLNVHLNQFIM